MLLHGMLSNGPRELAAGHIEWASVPHPPIRQEARPGFNLKPGRERSGHTCGPGCLAGERIATSVAESWEARWLWEAHSLMRCLSPPCPSASGPLGHTHILTHNHTLSDQIYICPPGRAINIPQLVFSNNDYSIWRILCLNPAFCLLLWRLLFFFYLCLFV